MASKSNKTYTLSNGKKIPAIGLGTWQSTEDEVYNAVTSALNDGYRHIDTAYAYGNESVIGRAIKDSKIPREDIFVTTKLWSTYHTNPEVGLDLSLNNLGLEYVDLFLIHWPVALNPNGNDLLEAETTTIKPVVNQVELHPYLPQHELLKYATENEIYLEAYSPLGSSDSPLLKDETLVELANKYNVPVATILISWGECRGTIVLPKSVTPSRIRSNLEVVQLEAEDIEKIDNIHKRSGIKRLIDPDWSPIKVFNDI